MFFKQIKGEHLMPIHAVTPNILLKTESHLETNKQNATAIDNVSNSSLQLTLQAETKDLPVGTRGSVISQLISDKITEIDNNFLETLHNATPSSLLYELRNCTIPEKPSAASIKQLRDLLTKYHPDILTTSPLIDAQGNPVKIESTGRCWGEDGMSGVQVFFQNSKIAKIIDDYKAHKDWVQSNLSVRTIEPNDVPEHEKVLIGQEGLFALNDIKKGDVVCLFGGMLLENKIDIENDKKIRKLANCDHYYNTNLSFNGKDKYILEGMEISMKINSAKEKNGSGNYCDYKRRNLSAYHACVERSSDKKPLQLLYFYAYRDIKAGEQLCFDYNIFAKR